MDELAQPEDSEVVKGIDDIAPLASAAHNSGLIEDLQMPGDVWLVSIQGLHQFSYRQSLLTSTPGEY